MQTGNHKNGSYTIETERCQVPSKNIREKRFIVIKLRKKLK